MKTALVCIAKDEDHYIDEWILYHFKLGFSKIIIYQNDWRYNGQFKDSDFIQLIEYDGLNDRQIEAYNNFIKTNYKNYDWAGFLDIDEFVVLKKTTNISYFLKDYNEFYSLGLNWNMFGGNGLEFNNDYSVIKRFIKCKKILIEEVKCFINFNKSKNSLLFKDNDPHNIDSYNKTISVDKTHFINGHYNCENLENRDIAYINHYYIKTKYEWDQKISRGWPGTEPPKEYAEYLYNKRNSIEYNIYEDLTAYNFFVK